MENQETEKEYITALIVLAFVVGIIVTALITYHFTARSFEFELDMLRRQIQLYGSRPWF